MNSKENIEKTTVEVEWDDLTEQEQNDILEYEERMGQAEHQHILTGDPICFLAVDELLETIVNKGIVKYGKPIGG